MVPVFTGLLTRADGLEAASAVRLYNELLSAALAGLPAGIDRLIVVPDGPLHHLPFDALRAQPDAEPLAARYEMVVAPSATVWRHWRNSVASPASRRALALADPHHESSVDAGAAERTAALQRGLRLGRLPHARAETRALERHLVGVDALVGARASEKDLKTRDLRNYDILHLAAHAIADEARPERSAVILAAGAESEDGLLQAREIQALDLEGRVVVLSACQTASGAILSGEGVLSLARAFFEAGAHAVIGTRWPIRDEDAAMFFEGFYRHLGSGASLSAALRQAKVEAIAAGRPAAGWASLVLLGNGDIRPGSHGAAEAQPNRWGFTALLLTTAFLVALAVSRSRRRSRTPSAV
jgi:CHAT domain-containing protein